MGGFRSARAVQSGAALAARWAARVHDSGDERDPKRANTRAEPASDSEASN